MSPAVPRGARPPHTVGLVVLNAYGTWNGPLIEAIIRERLRMKNEAKEAKATPSPPAPHPHATRRGTGYDCDYEHEHGQMFERTARIALGD